MKPRTNAEWLRDLRTSGKDGEAAIADLRVFVQRAAFFSLSRQRAMFGALDRATLEQLAEEATQEAVLAILEHLDEFRSESKFTTWAYKFGVNLALVAARREHWKNTSLDELIDGASPQTIEDDRAAIDPSRAALQTEAWSAIRDIMDHDLTERQRLALEAIAFADVPLDEVARRWGANRNATYKLLHDARRKLKSRLQARGFELAELMQLFGGPGKIARLRVTNEQENLG